MKKKIIYFFLIICFQSISLADDKVYFLDIDYLLNNSNSGKKILQHLNNTNLKIISELEKDENNLKKTESEISKKKNIISKVELEKEITNLKNEIKLYRQKKDKKTKELNNLKDAELKNFFENITPHIESFMEQNSIKIILDKKNIFIANSNYDITQSLINYLNEKIK